MSTHRPQPLRGQRRRKNQPHITLSVFSTSKHFVFVMSSRQNGHDQFEQFHAWRASQHSGPQLNFGASLGDFEGAARGPHYGEFNQFNCSSMMFPSSSGLVPPPTDTIDHILRIAAQVDHEVLVRSGNEAYANALALHKGTKAELDSLRCVVYTLC